MPAAPSGSPRIFLIAAVAENGVIGRDNQLPWKLSSDLQRFKRLTMGHVLIVGRRTFESIGYALPGRDMIVLSRTPGYGPPGVRVAGSLARALELAGGEDEIFVGGGSDLFRQALPLAGRIYLTVVHARIEGDTFFPQLESDAWETTSREFQPADARNEYASTFRVLDRRGPRKTGQKRKGTGESGPLFEYDPDSAGD